MANMQLTKTPMAEQDPQVRNQNFLEVARGYTLEEAMNEAKRCIHCKNPACVSGCPVGIPIPEFLDQVAQGNIAAAYEILSNANALPAISGRVCPQENQCEGKCVRGIKGEPVAIGRVERFVADWAAQQGVANTATAPKNGRKVAVIGSGPAGLTCAGELARMGYSVTVFEAFHLPGGVLTYGIPEFRLPKAIVAREVANLEKMGVEIQMNMVIGKVLTIPELFDMGYESVFIGSGAGLPMFMKIPGESLVGVYSANEYLTRINLMKAYQPDSETSTTARWRWWAAATWPWTPPAAPSAWGQRSTSFTAALTRSCLPGRRRSTTPGRRASFSTCSPTLSLSRGMRRGMWSPSPASGWSWESRTPPAAAARCPSRAVSSPWRRTPSSWPWGPVQTP